ncbi:glycosyltransferase [Ilyomonas limi]|uniref:Glycosyltransferase n=1 Tax=Ilyomonas limi TaxID=2575867 RepID=A0A4U3L9E4_9BACT|nr:glycosyltransferase [Ilyomonas limi]TKK70337.1 glycosyltransferase [Ilyomonas limi]
MKKVLFVYKYLPQYRIDFFQNLKEELLNDDIQLELIYGKSKNGNELRGDEVDLPWATYVPNRSFKIGNSELVWQPCFRKVKGATMIIVQPEIKLLLNYYLMISRHFQKYKLGFWGHGRNMQGAPNSLRNKFNNVLLNKCDWWFAYTTGVKGYLLSHNYTERNITVVQNAIDTFSLSYHYNKLTDSEVNALKDQLGIKGDKTGIYCGAMYREKRIDFILEACYKIKGEIPEFNMIFIGAGVEADKVKRASEANKWIHYIGPKFGLDRVVYFKVSTIQLMPSAVGLGILDSFALETPIITTDSPFHGPEIDYLENNKNGVITKNSLESYVERILNIFKTDQYKDLTQGCKSSVSLYTVEVMVKNFKDGILSCLNN